MRQLHWRNCKWFRPELNLKTLLNYFRIEQTSDVDNARIDNLTVKAIILNEYINKSSTKIELKLVLY